MAQADGILIETTLSYLLDSGEGVHCTASCLRRGVGSWDLGAWSFVCMACIACQELGVGYVYGCVFILQAASTCSIVVSLRGQLLNIIFHSGAKSSNLAESTSNGHEKTSLLLLLYVPM